MATSRLGSVAAQRQSHAPTPGFRHLILNLFFLFLSGKKTVKALHRSRKRRKKKKKKDRIE
jgi:hypothetical protein